MARCKVGDMAIITGSDEGMSDGGMVNVRAVYVHPTSDLPWWVCEAISPIRNVMPLYHGMDMKRPMPPGATLVCPDSILTPIGGDGQEDGEDLRAPVPVEKMTLRQVMRRRLTDKVKEKA